MFEEIIWTIKGLSNDSKVLWCLIKYLHDETKGGCDISIELLCELLECKERQVQRYIKDLVDRDLLQFNYTAGRKRIFKTVETSNMTDQIETSPVTDRNVKNDAWRQICRFETSNMTDQSVTRDGSTKSKTFFDRSRALIKIEDLKIRERERKKESEDTFQRSLEQVVELSDVAKPEKSRSVAEDGAVTGFAEDRYAPVCVSVFSLSQSAFKKELSEKEILEALDALQEAPKKESASRFQTVTDSPADRLKRKQLQTPSVHLQPANDPAIPLKQTETVLESPIIPKGRESPSPRKKREKKAVSGLNRAKDVFTTEEEHQKLIDKFGEEITLKCYAYLSEWKESADPATVKKHGSDYLRITRWVASAVRERDLRERELAKRVDKLDNPKKYSRQYSKLHLPQDDNGEVLTLRPYTGD